MRRIAITKRILKGMGIQPERLRLEWVSASEGARFQEVVDSFTQEIRTLGPMHLKEWLLYLSKWKLLRQRTGSE
jgi:coenzyme F420-reducing hydrogenase delta subunit